MMVAVLLTAMVVSASDYNPQVVMQASDEICKAWDGNGFVYATCHKAASKLTYTVYDTHFNETKRFTIPYDEGFYYNVIECNGVTRVALLAVKGVFTTDGKWTVFVQDEDGSGLYDEDGKRIGSLPGYGGELYFTDLANTDPVFISKSYDDNGKTIWNVWDFKGNSAGAYSPQVRTVLSGYPNPLPKGETFTVELPKVSDGRTVVVVTDMSGRQVYRDGVAQGQETVRITPDSVAEGMLIYTVIYGDGETVSGRLIAK